ncbi:hypothetical protein [Crystallibacter degradans]|uniref:hypothetical protein n=1 Tax=Crystallibacter degradans TaxID=2726743 RepID=UPI00147512F1|nr:hypothetical protein [Arthrobacter sp. SF27]NMR28101.1 hypothetical protein [Arthrobacter sp. SF27]
MADRSFRGDSQDKLPPEPELVSAAVNMHRSMKALGAAAAAVETPVSPQVARSVQATENVWRAIEAEFGLLTSTQVSAAVGSSTPNRSFASDQRKAGKLIAIERPGGLRYPGFQFDRETHAVRPVIRELIRTARTAGRTDASLALWMVAPTGYLDGDRPVDRLTDDPEAVVDAAGESFSAEW